MKHLSIGIFAEQVLGKKMYPYQVEIGDAILDSIFTGAGRTFCVMMARQMGKNETSAILEAYLLFAMEQGNVVKAAPTYRPQIINSKLRLLSMLESPLIRDRIFKSYGYIIGLAPDPSLVSAQMGPRVFFFSAGPESNVVGATASLLLEVDEAQDVAISKYDVELKPMASTRNATTVMWGTAWSDDTLLARQLAHNADLEEQDGIRRNFQYDWRTLAAINPNYGKFVEGEIARLGEDHISIRTQYRLLPIDGAGYLFNELQRYLLRGSHSWQDGPEEDGFYIAGLDIGGEQRAKPGDETKGKSKRDSTILTIARVSYTDLDLPRVEIVHQTYWTGMRYLDQYEAIKQYVENWQIRRLVVDKSGLGEGMAALLMERFGEERVTLFQFTRSSKSTLTYQTLSLVNAGRLKIYAADGVPTRIAEECWRQLKLAKYAVPGEGLMTMYCEPPEHDDFLMSVALTGEALKDVAPPPTDSVVLRPRRIYRDGRF